MVTLSGPDMERLKEIAYPSIGEEELSKMELLRGKKKNYELILDVLNRLTNLRYFIPRYISEATLMPEMRFIHRCFTTITGNEVEAVVIDTMGLDNRKKNILATYHGRYHKIGIADLRAVSTDMKPTAKHF